ncbi:MAG: FixH family protein, partial [Magnetococcales bacterium]|nr:FixH family protein [Magnetococcales bacterium]
MNNPIATQTPSAKRLNPWPTAIVAAFVLVIGVNLLMAHWAVNTFPGVTTTDHYHEGMAYNQTLIQRQAQKNLGVSMDLSHSPLTGQVNGA